MAMSQTGSPFSEVNEVNEPMDSGPANRKFNCREKRTDSGKQRLLAS